MMKKEVSDMTDRKRHTVARYINVSQSGGYRGV